MININIMSALQDRRVQVGLAAVGLFFVALILADCDTSRTDVAVAATTHAPTTVPTVSVTPPTQDEDTLEIVSENTEN